MSPTQSLSSSILVKKAGEIIPEANLKAALIGTTSVGYAIQDVDKDGNAFIFSEKDDAQADITNLMELQDTAKERTVVFFFGRGDTTKGDSVQPFIYQVDGEDVLAIFLEGNFPGYTNNNGQSDEKNVLDEILLPSLAKAMKIADGDSDAFFAELKDSLFHKTLLNTAAHRAVFAILPLEGDLIAFGENDLGKEYPWGTSSQGIVEEALLNRKEPAPKKEEPVAEAAPPRRTGFLKKAGAAAVAAVQAVASEQITTDSKTGVHTVKKTDAPATAAVQSGVTKIEIPRHYSNKDRKDFIRKNMQGQLPKAWRQMTHIEVSGPQAAVALAEANKAAAQVNAKKPDLKVVGNTTIKDVATPGTNDRAAALAAAETNMMTLSAKEKQDAEEFILKHLDFNSKNMPDPKEFAKMEAKYGSFSKQAGFDPQRMFFWPPDRVAEFFKRNQKYALLSFFEMRRRAEVAEKAAGMSKLSDQTGTDQTEEVVQQAAPSAAKPGGFLKKKAS